MVGTLLIMLALHSQFVSFCLSSISKTKKWYHEAILAFVQRVYENEAAKQSVSSTPFQPPVQSFFSF